jgi:hypothetical protein
MKHKSTGFFLALAFLLIAAGLWLNRSSIIHHLRPTDGEAGKNVSALPVEFVRERIAIDIEPEWVTVTGKYEFRCHDRLGEQFRILYPFPVDEHHGFPEEITVSQPGGAAISCIGDRKANAVRFAVNLLAKPEFTVVYRQRITAPAARYILTTTAAWQKPLERAVFIVSLPESLQPVSFSYEPDRVRRVNKRKIFEIERRNFLPDRDLSIVWK